MLRYENNMSLFSYCCSDGSAIIFLPQKENVRDFDPMEILKSGIFGDSDPVSNVEDFLADGITGFGKKLLMALIPSPETVGASLAIYTVRYNIFALKIIYSRSICV